MFEHDRLRFLRTPIGNTVINDVSIGEDRLRAQDLNIGEFVDIHVVYVSFFSPFYYQIPVLYYLILLVGWILIFPEVLTGVLKGFDALIHLPESMFPWITGT